ncbi:MAG: hypothetical protein IPO19_18225 [Rhodoferax sp.]|nr:hypothetical protein [Rhodoferax sp.]
MGDMPRESPVGLTLQPDGKIVMLVSTEDSRNGVYASVLLRLNPDGSLDTSFNGTGKVNIDLRLKGFSDALAVQPDGKLVVAGSKSGNFAVTRINTDGSFDATFGINGTVGSDFGAFDQASTVVIEPDGKILVAGGSNSNFALIRYNADGSVDGSFGVSARLEVGAGQSVLLDGKAVISDPELAMLGYGGTSLTMARQGGANVNDVFLSKIGGSLEPLTEGANPHRRFHGNRARLSPIMAARWPRSFSDGATEALVNSVARQIAYSNGVDAVGSFIQMDWTFKDGNTGAQGPGGTVTT